MTAFSTATSLNRSKSGHRAATAPAVGPTVADAGVFGTESTLLTFLALIIIMMTFFIVLNTAATIDLKRADAAVTSIQSTFSGAGLDDARAVAAARLAGSDALRSAVSDIFANILPTTSATLVQSDDRLDIDVPAAVLFDVQTGRVRDPLPLLDRIVAVISAPPTALRYELVIADDAGREGASARAAALAASFVAHGMPPGALSVGVATDVATAGAGRLRFTFIILDAATGSVAARLAAGAP